jgi:hypothetical protein
MDISEIQNDLPKIIYSLFNIGHTKTLLNGVLGMPKGFSILYKITLCGCIHKRPIHITIDDRIIVYGIEALPD